MKYLKPPIKERLLIYIKIAGTVIDDVGWSIIKIILFVGVVIFIILYVSV